MINTEIGKMNKRVTWQPATETTTDGQIGTTYATGTEHWASVKVTGGSEGTVNNKVQADRNYEVIMRRVGDIKPMDRLLYESKILNVEIVIDTNERHRELVLTCTEIIN